MMSSRRRLLLASAAWLGVPHAVAAAATTSPLQLRADYTATSLIGEGDRITSGRLWRSRSALRFEAAPNGRPVTAIVRLDRNIGWLVTAEPRLAVETDLAALDFPCEVLKGGDGLRQVREGPERVNGRDTTRVRIERSAAAGGSFSGRVWVTPLGVIVRLTGEGVSRGRRGRTVMNFRDIDLRTLDPGLFEAPRGVPLIRVDGAGLLALLESLEGVGKGPRSP